MSAEDYESGRYWRKRMDLLYYRYIDYIVRAAGRDARSLLDVGTGNCPYLEWFDWIDTRYSVDIKRPYRSASVTGLQGDIYKLDLPTPFDIVTCLQVLEHVPDAAAFGKHLLTLGDLVVISVPFRWPAGRAKNHIHDPIDYRKLTEWMGREANYRIVIEEPFRKAFGKRMIALYHKDQAKTFGRDVAAGRRLPSDDLALC